MRKIGALADRRHGAALIWLGLTLLLGGCAVYQPHMLPDHAALSDSPVALQIDSAKLRMAGLQKKQVNLSDGLDMTEIAILAVLNNPELKVQRARRAMAGAQLFAAGLLPDPQFSANLDHPAGNIPGISTGWGLGLGYDIMPLITRQTRLAAAAAARSQVDLTLLWQEWQVAQQARSLDVRYQTESRQLALLRKTLKLYEGRYNQSARALTQGDLTLNVSGTDLAGLIGIYSQISQLEKSLNETSHSLNLLLGLKPETGISLSPLTKPASLEASAIQQGLAAMVRRRPDLLALQAGYRSQEAKVRSAVLAQFPSISIGINRARDTSALYTSGFAISLNLPVFSANRGAIAVERASRNELRTEYQTRLDQAATDIDQLVALQAIEVKQQHVLDLYLPKLQKMVNQARNAFRNGDIDALAFLNMETTLVNNRLVQISLLGDQWENRIALDTLLALPYGSLLQSQTRPAASVQK